MQGIHVQGKPLTGALIKAYIACPYCGAKAGDNCLDSKNRRKSGGSIHLIRKRTLLEVLVRNGIKVTVEKEES